MISHIVQILYYKNLLCVCPCIHPFYFKCIFLSNCRPNFDQCWQKDEYWQWLCESWKLRWSIIWSGFHIIKGAVCMCLFSFLSPISQQPLGRFGPNLAQRWVLFVSLQMLQMRMIGHTVLIYVIKKSFCGGFQTFLLPISQQPLWRFWLNLAGKWLLSVTL